MDKDKIAKFIKEQRNKKGITQSELADKLFITEKAISRWETARGTPDISLLLPLAKELDVSVSDILNGEKSNTTNENINDLIEYIELNKKGKYNFPFKISIICYIISILIFLIYLKLDYNSHIELNYFVRLLFIIISSLFVIIGNYIFSNNYIDKIDDKNKIKRISNIIIFIYYSILLFNMVFFARFSSYRSYNLVPFKSIVDIISNGSLYEIIINIFGNMFVFMPIEYFIIELFKVNRLSINITISFSLLLIIELLQYIFKLGVFDIDDIILCLIGMLSFYIFYKKIMIKLGGKYEIKN